ncbi:hypothetical protein [Amycolatopsis sp. lyj-112]|uniref:hypothetical protein n=1 Tax=Amycolatopsis sp. lyj-112 TaxID=2789288 RepID=UPI00397870EF
MRNGICRKFAFCFVVALATLTMGAPPSVANEGVANEGVTPPSAGDLAAAVRTAGTPGAIAFARSNFRQVHHIEPRRIIVGERGVPVYTLNPDFVGGAAGAPAGVLRSIAVTATADSGQKTTLRVTQDGEKPAEWMVATALSGNDEETLSARLQPGTVLLNEPQINGWYALSPAGVVLLQASLPQSPVGQLIPLSEYQRNVHDRYADKMAGSEYQRKRGIGFAQAEKPPADGLPTPAVTGLIAGGAALLVAALFVLRRKRRAIPR